MPHRATLIVLALLGATLPSCAKLTGAAAPHHADPPSGTEAAIAQGDLPRVVISRGGAVTLITAPDARRARAHTRVYGGTAAPEEVPTATSPPPPEGASSDGARGSAEANATSGEPLSDGPSAGDPAAGQAQRPDAPHMPRTALAGVLASAEPFALDLAEVDLRALEGPRAILDVSQLDRVACVSLHVLDRAGAVAVAVTAQSTTIELPSDHLRRAVVHCGPLVSITTRGPVGDDTLWVLGEPTMDVRWAAAEFAVIRDRVESTFGARIPKGWITEYIAPADHVHGEFDAQTTAHGLRIRADAALELGAEERIAIARALAQQWLARRSGIDALGAAHPLIAARIIGTADAIAVAINYRLGLIDGEDVADHLTQLERIAAAAPDLMLGSQPPARYHSTAPTAFAARQALAITALATRARKRGAWLFDALGSGPGAEGPDVDPIAAMVLSAAAALSPAERAPIAAWMAGVRPPVRAASALGAPCFRATTARTTAFADDGVMLGWSPTSGTTIQSIDTAALVSVEFAGAQPSNAPPIGARVLGSTPLPPSAPGERPMTAYHLELDGQQVTLTVAPRAVRIQHRRYRAVDVSDPSACDW